MNDIVGYSGTFLSGYDGRNDSLIRHHPTTRGAGDEPWYKVACDFSNPANNTRIVLHRELFFRRYEKSWKTRTIIRLRLTINDVLIPITGIEISFAWMNSTAKPDEERIITPDGALIFHSAHNHRQNRKDFTTWQGEMLTLESERTFM